MQRRLLPLDQFGFVPSSHRFDLTVQGWFATGQPARSGSVLQSWVDLLLHWDLNWLECYLLVTSLLSGDVWCGLRIVTAILTENMSNCVFDSAKQIILSHLNPSACNGMIVRWAEYSPCTVYLEEVIHLSFICYVTFQERFGILVWVSHPTLSTLRHKKTIWLLTTEATIAGTNLYILSLYRRHR